MKTMKKLCGVVVGVACAFSLLVLCGCGLVKFTQQDPIVGTWALIIEDGSLSQDYECTFFDDGDWSCDWMTGKYGDGSGSWQNETDSYLDHKGLTHRGLIEEMSERYEMDMTDVQVYVMDAGSDVESMTMLLEEESGAQILRLGSSSGSVMLLGKY